MRLRCLVFVFVALPLAAQTPKPRDNDLSNIQYCTGGEKRLMMDVFLPKHPIRTPTPAVLWIHGGGWDHGDKAENDGAVALAHEGFVTASLNYRLSGNWPFPANIEDCKCAIRFLRANAARFGIDPDRIGVAGASAGGHLAELVAAAGPAAGLEGSGGWPDVSSRVQAAAAWYGVSDFTVGAMQFQNHTGKVVLKLFRGSEEEHPEAYRQASPIFYVSKDGPPLLLAHGEKDDLVPFDQSVRMAEAWRKASLPIEFIPVKNAGHNFEQVGIKPVSPSAETVNKRTIAFFKRNLAGPAQSGPKP